MIFLGCDVGSLSAEAVILEDDHIAASEIIRVKARAEDSAKAVTDQALASAGLSYADIDYCCTTGYGRYTIPFSDINMSEISCHCMGAHYLNPEIHTIIDIGGQDCKVISIDENGLVVDFVMNDKCAAGTGRCLEILADALEVELSQLGPVSLKSRRPVSITNKCSIFMELEVMHHLYNRKKTKDIAAGINHAVALRVAALARNFHTCKNRNTPGETNTITRKMSRLYMDIQGLALSGKRNEAEKTGFAITGGVSKNIGVVRNLEDILGIRFASLQVDAQLVGALGAAVFARNALESQEMEYREAAV